MNVSEEVRLIANRYLHRVKKSGNDQIMALCPFHDNRNTPSFTMNLSKGLYYCFSCHESGNLQMFLKSVGVTWNVIERQYKDVIEATKKTIGRKKSNDPFVELRGKKTSHFRSLYLESSIESSQTDGYSSRGWSWRSPRGSMLALTSTTAESRFPFEISMGLS